MMAAKIISVLIGLLLTLGSQVYGRDSQIDTQKALVAKLRVTRPNGSTEIAAAIYVGKDSHRLCNRG